MAMMCMKSSTSVSSKFDRNVDVPLQKKMTSFTASARLLSLSSSPFGELFRDNFRYFQSKHRKESSEQQQQRGKKIIADDQRPLEWSFAGFLPLSLWLVFFFGGNYSSFSRGWKSQRKLSKLSILVYIFFAIVISSFIIMQESSLFSAANISLFLWWTRESDSSWGRIQWKVLKLWKLIVDHSCAAALPGRLTDWTFVIFCGVSQAFQSSWDIAKISDKALFFFCGAQSTHMGEERWNRFAFGHSIRMNGGRTALALSGWQFTSNFLEIYINNLFCPFIIIVFVLIYIKY